MSVSAKDQPGVAVFNLPNQLTVSRLILSIVLFVLMAFHCYLASMIVFIIAASTDWLDGYFARKYNLVTVLGRILDPFVDKVIVCGTFIFLVADPASQVAAWMAVVVVGRELLVTALAAISKRGPTSRPPCRASSRWCCSASQPARAGSFFRTSTRDSRSPRQIMVPPRCCCPSCG